MQFVVDKVVMGKVSLPALCFPPSIPFHQCSHTHPSIHHWCYIISATNGIIKHSSLSPPLHDKVQQSKPVLCLLHCAEAPRWQLHQWINMRRPVMHTEDISIAEILQLSNWTGKEVHCQKYSEIFRTLCKSLNLPAGCLLWGQQKPKQKYKASRFSG